MRNEFSYPEPDGVQNRVAEEAPAYESEGRTGCSTLARWPSSSAVTKRRFVAHTGADCSDRNASASEEGGLTHKTSSTGSVEEPQRKSCN